MRRKASFTCSLTDAQARALHQIVCDFVEGESEYWQGLRTFKEAIAKYPLADREGSWLTRLKAMIHYTREALALNPPVYVLPRDFQVVGMAKMWCLWRLLPFALDDEDRRRILTPSNWYSMTLADLDVVVQSRTKKATIADLEATIAVKRSELAALEGRLKELQEAS